MATRNNIDPTAHRANFKQTLRDFWDGVTVDDAITVADERRIRLLDLAFDQAIEEIEDLQAEITRLGG